MSTAPTAILHLLTHFRWKICLSRIRIPLFTLFDNRDKVKVVVVGATDRINDDLHHTRYTCVIFIFLTVRKLGIARVFVKKTLARKLVRRRRRETAKPAAERTKLDRRRFTSAICLR